MFLGTIALHPLAFTLDLTGNELTVSWYEPATKKRFFSLIHLTPTPSQGEQLTDAVFRFFQELELGGYPVMENGLQVIADGYIPEWLFQRFYQAYATSLYRETVLEARDGL